MEDNELYDLFSSFDEVSAPEHVKAAAFNGVMAAAAQEGAVEATATDPSGAQAADAAPVHVAPRFTARRGKGSARVKWRTIRVAAVAACLALALSGGAAYAYYTPVSYITITQGDATIELPVNLFGQTLAGTGNEAGLAILDGVDYRGKSLEDSVKAVSDSMGKVNPLDPITVTKKTNDTTEILDTNGMPLTGDVTVPGVVPAADPGTADGGQPVVGDGAAVEPAREAGSLTSGANAVESAAQQVVLPQPSGVVGGGAVSETPVAPSAAADAPKTDSGTKRSSDQAGSGSSPSAPVESDTATETPVVVVDEAEPSADEAGSDSAETPAEEAEPAAEPEPAPDDNGGVRPPKRVNATSISEPLD